MRAPSAPATPDPYATAAAQQMANVEVAIANTALLNADEDRPDASVRFEQTSDTITTNTYDGEGAVTGTRTFNRWKKTTTLSDDAQTQYDQQQDIAIALNDWALGQVGLLTTQQGVPFSLSLLTPRLSIPAPAAIDTSVTTPGALQHTIGETDLTAHMAEVRDAIDSRLQYQINIDRENRIAALAHKGISAGMPAFEREMDTFDKASTDARVQAFLAAGQEQTRIVQTEKLQGDFKNAAVVQQFQLAESVIDARNKRRMDAYKAIRDLAEFISTQRAQELQERITERATNINEISTLMHGGQISIPQFQNFNASPIAQTPVADSVYRSAAMDMTKWQQQVKSQQQMMGGLLGFSGNMVGGMLSLGMF